MKMHIGVDETPGLVHSVATTVANVHDLTPADQLLHGEEKRVFADAGYQGIHKRGEHKRRNVDWYVAMRPGKRKMLEKDSPEAREQTLQASIRAKVEHPFKVIKQVLGDSKVRYRGLLRILSDWWYWRVLPICWGFRKPCWTDIEKQLDNLAVSDEQGYKSGEIGGFGEGTADIGVGKACFSEGP
jgi:hypothetical protein